MSCHLPSRVCMGLHPNWSAAMQSNTTHSFVLQSDSFQWQAALISSTICAGLPNRLDQITWANLGFPIQHWALAATTLSLVHPFFNWITSVRCEVTKYAILVVFWPSGFSHHRLKQSFRDAVAITPDATVSEFVWTDACNNVPVNSFLLAVFFFKRHC